MVQRNLAGKSKPTVEITEAGGRWTIKRLTALKNTEVVFELGKECEFERFDGSRITSIFTLDGNKLEEKQHGDDLPTVTATWKFSSVDLTVVSLAGEVNGTEVYKRL
jgi:hypothetical protein